MAQEMINQGTDLQAGLGFGQGVSGGPGISQNFSRKEDVGWSKAIPFSMTYIHFLGPGTEYAGTTIGPDDEGRLCFEYDWGASVLAFNNTQQATTPQHLIHYMSECNSWELHGHSVHCEDLICSRDEIQADGRIVTTPQQDSIEIFEDTQGKLRPHNIVPLGVKDIFSTNLNFQRVEPRTIDEGMLPRVKIRFPPEMYTACKEEKLNDLHIRGFDPYNGLFTIGHWRTGENFDREYKMNSGRLPVGMFADILKLPCNKNRLQVANELLKTIWGMQANMATEMNRSPIIPPSLPFMRFAPYYTATGLAQRRAQFKATYTCNLVFHFSPNQCLPFFMQGTQGFRNNFAYNDKFLNCRADKNRYNIGTHAEDFVIPMTSYVHDPDKLGKEDDTELDKYDEMEAKLKLPGHAPIPANKQDKTTMTQDVVAKKYADMGIQTNAEIIGNTLVSQKVTLHQQAKKPAPVDDPQKPQMAPEFTKTILKKEGFTDQQIEEFNQLLDDPKNDFNYDLNDDGVIVDSNNRAIEIPPLRMDDTMVAVPIASRAYKPADAWRALGFSTPRKWTTPWASFVPFPTLRSAYSDKSAGYVKNGMVRFTDIELAKKLNKTAVAKGKKNLSILSAKNTAVMFPGPKIEGAANLVTSSQRTLPLQVTIPKQGPKLPPNSQADIQSQVTAVVADTEEDIDWIPETPWESLKRPGNYSPPPEAKRPKGGGK